MSLKISVEVGRQKNMRMFEHMAHVSALAHRIFVCFAQLTSIK